MGTGENVKHFLQRMRQEKLKQIEGIMVVQLASPLTTEMAFPSCLFTAEVLLRA